MKNDQGDKVISLAPFEVNDFEKEAIVYEAIGSKIRLAILYLMKKYGETYTRSLIPALNLSQPTVTSHLNKLYRAGIIKKREQEKFTFYSINEEFCYVLDGVFKNINKMEKLKETA
ncbi:MAG: ArsR/SmtB family transcription factor [Thermoplasmata archaeon]